MYIPALIFPSAAIACSIAPTKMGPTAITTAIAADAEIRAGASLRQTIDSRVGPSIDRLMEQLKRLIN